MFGSALDLDQAEIHGLLALAGLEGDSAGLEAGVGNGDIARCKGLNTRWLRGKLRECRSIGRKGTIVPRGCRSLLCHAVCVAGVGDRRSGILPALPGFVRVVDVCAILWWRL